MSTTKKCPLYREATGAFGKGLGTCDFNGCQSICDGDIRFCEKPDALSKYFSDEKTKKEGSLTKRESPDLKKIGTLNMNSRPYNVLIVDDEEPIRTLIVALLSRGGHHCATATDGREALDKLKSDRYDAVITDIVMGVMDGITLTKEILGRYPGLPVMVTTGYTDDYSAEGAIEAGAKEFIKKPFSITELDLRFRKMMRDHETWRREQEKGHDMVFNLQRESSEKIERLEKKIETLEGRAHNYDPELWR